MKTNALWYAGGMVLAFLTPAWGWFNLVDDFEEYSLGPIASQSDWSAFEDASAVVVDPDDPSNQVLAVTAVSTRAYRPASILDGTVRMMYMRFRYGSQINCSFGLSDVNGPFQFVDYEVQLDLGSSREELRILNDNSFDVLTTVQSNQWYNLWMLVNNETDETWVYLNPAAGSDSSEGDRQDNDLGEQVFVFRTGVGASMASFFIKTGGGNSDNAGPLFIDDIYIENQPALSLFTCSTRPLRVLPTSVRFRSREAWRNCSLPISFPR